MIREDIAGILQAAGRGGAQTKSVLIGALTAATFGFVGSPLLYQLLCSLPHFRLLSGRELGDTL